MEDVLPFLAGLLVQLLGSLVQARLLQREVRQQMISLRARQALARDGDLVQLLCTSVTVIVSAILALADRPVFLGVTALVALVVVIGSFVFWEDVDPGVYDGHSWRIFTPACDLACLVCVAGGIAALLS